MRSWLKKGGDSMKRIDIYFLLLATVLLICGAVLGIVMGAQENFQLAPVHAHLNLAGWASLALFGLTYRAYPQLAATRLAGLHFVVSATGSVLLPIGIGFAVLRNEPTLAIVASMLWLLGVLLFLAQLVRLARERSA
jgi:phosphotransferase system  glucose/maltose/N-acetylglucosamine-specific IIC component